VPVDLNALVYKLECTLAAAYGVAGDSERAKLFEDRAQRRRRLIQTLCFDDEEGFFVDLSLAGWTASGTLSLAGAFPLFFELATPEQASRVSQRIQREFLKPGGWVTTLNHTGQQWDAPNGWAPLQWIVYAGLRNYGFADEANEGARRWIENNCISSHGQPVGEI
jgi:alpha,alpha-trehalase